MFIVALIATTISATAQQEIKLTVNHLLGSSKFAFNTAATNDLGHSFKLQRLEYYVSGISIKHDGGKITNIPDVYILMKTNRMDTISLGKFDVTNLESITFAVGVDPFVNNGDPAGWKSTHPLAPKLPSMHWGWTSGYRFVALEGKSGSNFGQELQIHGLGNQNFFKQNIPTKGTVINGGMLITLNADYTKALSKIAIEQGLVEHSESSSAAVCLRNFQTKVFSNTEGEGNTLAVLDEEVYDAFQIFPNPSSGEIHLQMNDSRFNGGNLTVINLLGESVVQINGIEALQQLNLQTTGVYFAILQKNGLVSTKRLVVK